MRAMALVTLGILSACTRGGGDDAGAPSASAAASVAPPPAASSAPGLAASIHAPPQINAPMAESIAMTYAARHWPKYHPRMASAFHSQGYWKVVIEFKEPVGANLILDQTGAVVDGGTSTGER